MHKPLFVTLATGAVLLVGGGVAVAMAGEPVGNTSPAAIARQTADPTDEPSIEPSITPTARPADRTPVSREQAEAIALRRVGGGQIESTDLESEDGRLVWDVDVIRQGVKWEVEIDSRSGHVVEFKTDGDRDDRRDDHGDRDDDRDDRGDHHGDDDRRGHDDNSGPGSDNSGPGGSGDDD